MPRHAILRQSHTKTTTFDPVVHSLRQAHLWESAGDGAIAEWVALPQGTTAGENFDRAAVFLTDQLGEGRILTVLVDEVDPLKLDPLMPYGWNTLIAMLVLAFPEVRWHFLTLTGRPPETQSTEENKELNRWRRFQVLHGIAAVQERRGSPLFDGYGIRQHVLENIFLREGQGAIGKRVRISGSVPKRRKLATVLDEEEGYRWLLACMAYRNGFRVHAISSWREAEALLAQEGKLMHPSGRTASPGNQTEDFALSLEDWFLGYPDQTIRGMSKLDYRSEILPALGSEPPPLRRFLTVGHEKQSNEQADLRKEQLRQLREAESIGTGKRLSKKQQITYKPASGLYTLWKDMGLTRDWNQNCGEEISRRERRRRLGLAPGYIWPPDSSQSVDNSEEDGHSSEGRLLDIAEHLIKRATGFIDSVNTTTEAIRGAVLATQALELLGGKTPTVSVEALQLKHEFEVTAECQFVGVEYHLSMDERLKDIRKNLKAMSQWLHTSRRKDFMLNAEAMIVTRLIATLDEYGEYEESQFCQKRLRYLHHSVTHRNDLRTNWPLAILLWPFRAYIEFVLRSLGYFSGALAIVTLLFCVGFKIANPAHSTGLHSTMLAFFTVSFQDTNVATKLLSYSAAATGVLNFGLLVTYLYSKMIRK
jgi:hypothetical protein